MCTTWYFSKTFLLLWGFSKTFVNKGILVNFLPMWGFSKMVPMVGILGKRIILLEFW